MSGQQRLEPLYNSPRPARILVLSKIPLQWTWLKVLYLYGGLFSGPIAIGGFVFIAIGWPAIGLMVVLSPFVIRRFILWFDILRIEPSVVKRIGNIMRLERFILPGRLSIKQGLLSFLFSYSVLSLGLSLGLIGLVGAVLFLFLVLLSEFIPPFVLFLGSSERSTWLFQRVMAGCVPHRAITLLMLNDWAIDKWRARTSDAAHWREVVHRLARDACIVILDAQFLTDPISEECDWLLKEGMDYKLIVVGDSSGNCPVLDKSLSRLGLDVSYGEMVVATPETVQGVVNMLASSGGRVPSAIRPACSILRGAKPA